MGGDRDGNPYVTPSTTRDVVITARLAATNLYFKAVEKLMYELSVWRSSDEARVRPLPLQPELRRTLRRPNSKPPHAPAPSFADKSTGAIMSLETAENRAKLSWCKGCSDCRCNEMEPHRRGGSAGREWKRRPWRPASSRARHRTLP